MRVFEVLAKMLRSVEYLWWVAFTELVLLPKVDNALLPVFVRGVSSVLCCACPVEIDATKPASVGLARMRL